MKMLLLAATLNLAPQAPEEFKEAVPGERIKAPGCYIEQHDCMRLMLTLEQQEQHLAAFKAQNEVLQEKLVSKPGWTSALLMFASGLLLGGAVAWKLSGR